MIKMFNFKKLEIVKTFFLFIIILEFCLYIGGLILLKSNLNSSIFLLLTNLGVATNNLSVREVSTPLTYNFSINIPYSLIIKQRYNGRQVYNFSLYPYSIAKYLSHFYSLEQWQNIINRLNILVNTKRLKVNDNTDNYTILKFHNKELFLNVAKFKYYYSCHFLGWWQCKEVADLGNSSNSKWIKLIYKKQNKLKKPCPYLNNSSAIIDRVTAIGPYAVVRDILPPNGIDISIKKLSEFVHSASSHNVLVLQASPLEQYFWGKYLAMTTNLSDFLNNNDVYFYLVKVKFNKNENNK